MEAKRQWRYWQADLLLERGRDAEAKGSLNACTEARFYPMNSRWQRLGERVHA